MSIVYYMYCNGDDFYHYVYIFQITQIQEVKCSTIYFDE